MWPQLSHELAVRHYASVWSCTDMKSPIENFPEHFYIKSISDALWSGRAAIMVGAGFSRNAEPVRPGVPPMALWKDLIQRIWIELGRDINGHQYPSFGDDALRLAEEYQQTFGRAALDNLIERSTPDELYQPSDIFIKLLDLPWRDVFTTNYDRLLERTHPKLELRSYDLVLTEEDLSQKNPPRIVKLHGSFPSHRPYVFTSEDYRRYPREHAPFVNLVQQSVLENIFLLVGFSGDDPNFLQWAGWVRDHLGTHAPPIFLCGIFDYGSSQRSYLKGIGVTLIDLGPVFSRAEYDQVHRHKASLTWFLQQLYAHKPVEFPTWPENIEDEAGKDKNSNGSPLGRTRRTPKAEEPVYPSGNGSVTSELFNQLLMTWRGQREKYSGWVILPEENRKSIELASAEWLYHSTSASKLLKLIESETPAQRIEMLFEIVWRTQKLMTNLPPWLHQCIVGTLELINPKPSDIPIKSHAMARGDSLSAEFLKGQNPWLCWDRLTEQWVELALQILSEAWTLEKEGEFNCWSTNLQLIVASRLDWLARWHSIRCWYFLMKLDLSSLEEELEQWPSQSSLPFWEAKRAAYKWIVGERKQARELAFSAYRSLARAAESERGTYRLRSELGWISLLCWDVSRLMSIREITDNQLWNTLDEKRIAFHSKLDALIPHRCDPRKDLTLRAEYVSSVDRPGSDQSMHPGFDPGQVIESHNIRSGLDASEGILLRTYCEAPSLLILDEKSRECLLKNIFPEVPQVAISFLILTGGNDKVINTIFNRHSLFLMSTEKVTQIYSWLMPTIRKAWAETYAVGKEAAGMRLNLIKFGIEILSRISTRLLPAQREDLFDFAKTIFDYIKKSTSESNVSIVSTVNDFLKRSLFCLSNDQLSLHLPWLIESFPVNKPNEVWYRDLSDPFFYIGSRLMRAIKNRPHQRELIGTFIDLLFSKLADPTSHIRVSIIVRLGCLTQAEILTPQQKSHFADLLWSQIDSKTGLPARTGYAIWAFLWLPEQCPGQAKAAVKSLLKGRVPTSSEGSSFAVPLNHLKSLLNASAFPWRDASENTYRITWDDEERDAIWGELSAWWLIEQKGMAAWANEGGMVGEQCQSLASIAVKILVEIVLQKKTPLSEDTSKQINQFIIEMENIGYRPAMISLVRLMTGSLERTGAMSEIRNELFVHQNARLDMAIDALVTWCKWGFSSESPLGGMPIELIDAVCFIIASRHWPGLPLALDGLQKIVRICSSALSPIHLSWIADGLNKLANEELAHSPRAHQTHSHIPTVHKPEVIRLTAELAAILARVVGNYPPLSEALQRWREFGSNADALPELRHPWADGEIEGAGGVCRTANENPDE